ncbi:hypothetical protein OF83DRAFT_450041 [Amylostereum chailletii]|nr:hypothetical protein OF83DRAFT_450041 [Amylostereum chailletii]
MTGSSNKDVRDGRPHWQAYGISALVPAGCPPPRVRVPPSTILSAGSFGSDHGGAPPNTKWYVHGARAYSTRTVARIQFLRPARGPYLYRRPPVLSSTSHTLPLDPRQKDMRASSSFNIPRSKLSSTRAVAPRKASVFPCYPTKDRPHMHRPQHIWSPRWRHTCIRTASRAALIPSSSAAPRDIRAPCMYVCTNSHVHTAARDPMRVERKSQSISYPCSDVDGY